MPLEENWSKNQLLHTTAEFIRSLFTFVDHSTDSNTLDDKLRTTQSEFAVEMIEFLKARYREDWPLHLKQQAEKARENLKAGTEMDRGRVGEYAANVGKAFLKWLNGPNSVEAGELRHLAGNDWQPLATSRSKFEKVEEECQGNYFEEAKKILEEREMNNEKGKSWWDGGRNRRAIMNIKLADYIEDIFLVLQGILRDESKGTLPVRTAAARLLFEAIALL